MKRHVIDRETPQLTEGHVEERKDDDSPWVRLPHSEWVQYPLPAFAKGPAAILTEMGIEVDPRRAREFDDFADGAYPVYYYLGVAARGGVGEEALKWVMGGLATELNVRNISAIGIGDVLPARALNEFLLAMRDSRFERNFAKPIFAELLSVYSDPSAEDTVLDRIISDPRFKAVDSSEIDIVLDKIIADNPDQFEKAKENPKLIQWFVGQAMKATQGKAQAPVIIEKMNAKINA